MSATACDVARCKAASGIMGHVYIMANRRNGTLYIGVTGNLANRIWLHRIGKGSEFCAKWSLTRLVLVETYPTMLEAIAREKAMKMETRVENSADRRSQYDWDGLFETINS